MILETTTIQIVQQKKYKNKKQPQMLQNVMRGKQGKNQENKQMFLFVLIEV